MIPVSVNPNTPHTLIRRRKCGRPVRANREKARLSACFTWLIRNGEAGVKLNPCTGRQTQQGKATRTLSSTTNSRLSLWGSVASSVVYGNDLSNIATSRRYRYLDIETSSQNVSRMVRRAALLSAIGKARRGAVVDIAVTPEIEAILHYLKMNDAEVDHDMTLIHRLDGHPYTYDCLSMLRLIIKEEDKEFRFL